MPRIWQTLRTVPRRAVALALFVAASLGLGILAFAKGWVHPELIQQTVGETGAWGMAIYIITVVVLELMWIPRAWGLFAGGVLFGPVIGCLLSLVADMVGAVLCYLAGRGGGREWVRGQLDKRPGAAKIVTLLAERRGALTVAFMRCVPVAHYTGVSYAAGLAGVPLWAFIWGNALGLLPGAILYPLMGDAALNPTGPVFLIGLALIAAAMVASIFVARRYLRQRDSAPADPPANESSARDS